MKSITPFQPKPVLKPTVRRIASLDNAPSSAFPFERDSELTFKGDSPVIGELLMLLLESMRQFRAQSGSANISVSGNTTVIRQNICTIVNNYRAAVSGNMSTELRSLLANIEHSFSGGDITGEQTAQFIDGLSVQLSRMTGTNQKHTANVSELTSTLAFNRSADISGVISELKKNAEITRVWDFYGFIGHTDRFLSSASEMKLRIAEDNVSMREFYSKSAMEHDLRTRNISHDRKTHEHSGDNNRSHTESITERYSSLGEIWSGRTSESRKKIESILSGFLRKTDGAVTIRQSLAEQKTDEFRAGSGIWKNAAVLNSGFTLELTREMTGRARVSEANRDIIISRDTIGQSYSAMRESLQNNEYAESTVSVSEAVLRLMNREKHKDHASAALFFRERRSLMIEKDQHISTELLRERTNNGQNAVLLRELTENGYTAVFMRGQSENRRIPELMRRQSDASHNTLDLRSMIAFRNTERAHFGRIASTIYGSAEKSEPWVFREQERRSVSVYSAVRRAEVLRELRSSAFSEKKLSELRSELFNGKYGFGISSSECTTIPAGKVGLSQENISSHQNFRSVEKSTVGRISEIGKELIWSRKYGGNVFSVTEKLLRERENASKTIHAKHPDMQHEERAGSNNFHYIDRNTTVSENETHFQSGHVAIEPAAETLRIYRNADSGEVLSYEALSLLKQDSRIMAEHGSLIVLSGTKPAEYRSVFREGAVKISDIQEMLINSGSGSDETLQSARNSASFNYVFKNNNAEIRDDAGQLENTMITGSGRTDKKTAQMEHMSIFLDMRSRTDGWKFKPGSVDIRLAETKTQLGGEGSLPEGMTVRFGVSELIYASESELLKTEETWSNSMVKETDLRYSAEPAADRSEGRGQKGSGGIVGNYSDDRNGITVKETYSRKSQRIIDFRSNTRREVLRRILSSPEIIRGGGSKSVLHSHTERIPESGAMFFGTAASEIIYSGTGMLTQSVPRVENSGNSMNLLEIMRPWINSGTNEKTGFFIQSREQTEHRQTVERYAVREEPAAMVQALGGNYTELHKEDGLVLAAIPARQDAAVRVTGSQNENTATEFGSGGQDMAQTGSDTARGSAGTEALQGGERMLLEIVRSAVSEISSERQFTDKIQSALMSHDNAERLCGMVMERLESRLRTESRITGR